MYSIFIYICCSSNFVVSIFVKHLFPQTDTHDQWVKHRSSDRFINNLRTLPNSGIYKQVGKEVFLTTSIAISVCVWNALVGGYEDFGGAMHDPVIAESWAVKVGMPMTPFTVLNSSLGLLLGEFYVVAKFCHAAKCIMYIIF